jgi:O-antigen ligase
MIEFLYSLYLLSGISKVFLNFFMGDFLIKKFNITLVLAILLVLVNGMRWFKSVFLKSKFHMTQGTLSLLIIIVGFYSWMIISLLYTKSPQNSYIKTFLFLTNLVAFLFPFTYEGFDPKRFFKYFIFIGSVFVVLYLSLIPRNYISYMTDNREISGTYLYVGYLCGLNMLILLFINLDIKLPIKLFFVGINLVGIIISGARGPIIFFIMVLLLKFIFSIVQFLKYIRNLSFKKILVILICFIILIAGMMYTIDKYSANIDRSIERLKWVTDIHSTSVAVRLSLMTFAIDKIFESATNFLVGLGIGSFGTTYSGIDERLYPHNIILEIWFELGVIGVILFSLFIFLFIRKIRINSPLFYVFLFLILNTLKSSSLVDLRVMFGIFACMLVFTQNRVVRNQKRNAMKIKVCHLT